eukprot:TCALIF_02477-PA protein Name:"Similar to TkR99D Tachykinin-like peptides receptor 99D (Drosophila melanogaster)" AED:0.19 eAED:0.20 QI:19/0/0/0.6/0.75/0.8/5/0/554
MRSNFTGFHNGSNGELLKLATSSFEDVIDEALVEPPFDGRVPNMTVIDNMTYCWDEALQSYTWCHHEYQLYSVPLVHCRMKTKKRMKWPNLLGNYQPCQSCLSRMVASMGANKAVIVILIDILPISAVILFLSLCYGFISLVAIAGNILVFMVVAFTRSMQNVTNFYIANLASADVIIAVFCIPFQFYAALLQRWDLPEFMCKFCPFTQTLSVNVSIFTLVMISLDRYQAIMNPLAERSTKTTCKLIILGLWVFSAILALPMIFIFEFTYVFDESNGGVKPFCMLASLLEEDPHNGLESSLNNTTLSTSLEHHQEPGWVEKIMTLETYNLALTIVQYVLPLFIISFAYIRMGMKLWLSKTPGVAQVKRDEMIVVNKKKTIKMLVVVVTIFGICWLPWHLYQVSVILVPEINEYRYINIIFFFSHWLAMFNSCCNPFIYAIYSVSIHSPNLKCNPQPLKIPDKPPTKKSGKVFFLFQTMKGSSTHTPMFIVPILDLFHRRSSSESSSCLPIARSAGGFCFGKLPTTISRIAVPPQYGWDSRFIISSKMEHRRSTT